MSAAKRKLILLVGFVIVAGGLYWLQRDVAAFSQVVQQEEELRSWIAARPITAFAAGFSLYVLLSLIPGTGGKSVIFGWLYGFWQGLIIVDCALTIAAVIAFLFSRYVFAEVVEARLGGVLQWLNAALEREGGFYLLVVRLAHLPYTLVNYAAGATRVRTRTFWWTTQLGLLPGTMACVLVGSRLPSLAQLQQQGFWSLLDPALAAALLITALVPFAVRWGLKHWKAKDAAELLGSSGP